MIVAFVGVQNRALSGEERYGFITLLCGELKAEKLLTLDEWGTAETAQRVALQGGVDVFKYPTSNPRAQSRYQRSGNYAFSHDPAGTYESMYLEMVEAADALICAIDAEDQLDEWPEVGRARERGKPVWVLPPTGVPYEYRVGEVD